MRSYGCAIVSLLVGEENGVINNLRMLDQVRLRQDAGEYVKRRMQRDACNEMVPYMVLAVWEGNWGLHSEIQGWQYENTSLWHFADRGIYDFGCIYAPATRFTTILAVKSVIFQRSFRYHCVLPIVTKECSCNDRKRERAPRFQAMCVGVVIWGVAIMQPLSMALNTEDVLHSKIRTSD